MRLRAHEALYIHTYLFQVSDSYMSCVLHTFATSIALYSLYPLSVSVLSAWYSCELYYFPKKSHQMACVL